MIIYIFPLFLTLFQGDWRGAALQPFFLFPGWEKVRALDPSMSRGDQEFRCRIWAEEQHVSREEWESHCFLAWLS